MRQVETLDTQSHSDAFVSLRNIKMHYHEGRENHLVFDSLNAGFNKGEFAVLLGRSGSGKSTLLNLVSGIDIPVSGEVVIDSTNVTRLGETRRTLFRRKRIGFIFQAYNLIPTLSVLENLMLPLELNNFDPTQRMDRATSLLGELGLADRHDDFPDQLSGGEQQRVTVARALVHSPDLILADEPTGNLDIDTGREVLELLVSAVKDTATALIMATHSQECLQYADRVLTIRDHRLHPETAFTESTRFAR